MLPYPAFQVVLGIQTLVIMLVWQALYQLRHLLTLFFKCFSSARLLVRWTQEGGREMCLGCLEKRLKISVFKLFTVPPLESGLTHSAQQSVTEQAL